MPVNFYVCNPTPAMKDLATGTWNSRFVKFKDSDRTTRNEHEFSAQVRRNTEITLASNLATLIAKKQRKGHYRVLVFDVGGNPNRTSGTFQDALRHPDREVRYHAITPLMSETDYQRQLDDSRVGDCKHTFEECVHRGCLAKLMEEREADQNGPWDKTQVVLNFTDSVYYIDPQVILYALSRLGALAVGCNHTFPQVPGIYAVPHDTVNEGEATITSDGMVSMLVAGNKHSYYHPNFVLPPAAMPGTMFNANYSLSGLEGGTYHTFMDNTQYALSFEQQIRCGSYVGWRAIAVPITSTTSIPPGIREMRVSSYTAECLACRVSKREEVTVVVAKMMRRAKLPTDRLAVVVTQTMDQLASLDRPLETPGSRRRNWWYYAGKVGNFVLDLHKFVIETDNRNDDAPYDRAEAADLMWRGAEFVVDGEDPVEDEGQGEQPPPYSDNASEAPSESDKDSDDGHECEGGGDLDVHPGYKNTGGGLGLGTSNTVAPSGSQKPAAAPARTGAVKPAPVDESAAVAPAVVGEEVRVESEKKQGSEQVAVDSHTTPTGVALPEKAGQRVSQPSNHSAQPAARVEPAHATEHKTASGASQPRWVRVVKQPSNLSGESSGVASAKADPTPKPTTKATRDSSAGSAASLRLATGAPQDTPKKKPPPPPRRNAPLDKADRMKTGQTVQRKGKERAEPPEVLFGPPPQQQPPLPGPGIQPPVAVEPRKPVTAEPEPDIDYKKLWIPAKGK